MSRSTVDREKGRERKTKRRRGLNREKENERKEERKERKRERERESVCARMSVYFWEKHPRSVLIYEGSSGGARQGVRLYQLARRGGPRWGCESAPAAAMIKVDATYDSCRDDAGREDGRNGFSREFASLPLPLSFFRSSPFLLSSLVYTFMLSVSLPPFVSPRAIERRAPGFAIHDGVSRHFSIRAALSPGFAAKFRR